MATKCPNTTCMSSIRRSVSRLRLTDGDCGDVGRVEVRKREVACMYVDAVAAAP